MEFLRDKLLWRGLGLGLTSALLAAMLAALGVLQPLDRAASDALFRLRGPRAAQSRVVLILVDDATVVRAGRQPLPRRFYAQAVRRLRAAGAQTIAFNTLFGAPSDDAKQDAEFARACAGGPFSSRVVQGAVFDAPSLSSQPVSAAKMASFALQDKGGKARLALSVAAPLPQLLEQNTSLGHLNLRPENDGSLRRVTHLMRFGGQLYPSLPLACAALEQGISPAQLRATPQGVSFGKGAGEMQLPLDSNGEVLVNWLGDERTFPTFSMLQLLDGRVPSGALRGATVLIGSTVIGSFTLISTPFAPFSAFKYHQTALHLQANAIDDIVSGRVLRPLDWAAQSGLRLFFALATGVLVARRGARGAAAWTIAWSLILWALAGVLLSFGNIFVPIAEPQIAVLICAAACLGVRQFREGRELKVISDLFDGYVGSEVLRLVKSNRPKLDGEIRHVAVLFCDIRGFAALAESLSDEPETLLRLLNQHFEPLVTALKNHGAYVDNYVGDLVMAVFGAPVSEQSPDRNTRNAVLAALEVLEIVARRNRERRAAGETVIEVGVGVHCGPAIVGDVGTSRKKHYTAIGDTVNIASRVEGATRLYPTHFLVTEDVVNACRDHPDTARLPWRFVDETAVKGRRAVLRLYTSEQGITAASFGSETT